MPNKRKFQEPLAIDMPFEEALERFAQVEPSEGLVAGQSGLTLRGTKIREHEGDVCLNDLPDYVRC